MVDEYAPVPTRDGRAEEQWGKGFYCPSFNFVTGPSCFPVLYDECFGPCLCWLLFVHDPSGFSSINW